MAARRRATTTLEEKLMRAMGLNSVEELDELMARPTSEDAALHRSPPDEVYDLAEQMNEHADRLWEARKRFNELSESEYLN